MKTKVSVSVSVYAPEKDFSRLPVKTFIQLDGGEERFCPEVVDADSLKQFLKITTLACRERLSSLKVEIRMGGSAVEKKLETTARFDLTLQKSFWAGDISITKASLKNMDRSLAELSALFPVSIANAMASQGTFKSPPVRSDSGYDEAQAQQFFPEC